MRKLVVLTSAFAMVIVTAAMAMAGHVEPIVDVITKPADGGWSCADGIKIEPVESGTYDGITIVVDGDSFSFSAEGRVYSVIVKGGPDANLYLYPGGVRGDSGLTAPINPNNGRPYGLSHLCFEFQRKGDPPPKGS